MKISNGANQQTVEDLLSSIRSSIFDDTNEMSVARANAAAMPVRRESALGDDNAEFELPAIFKPGHHQPHSEKPNNIFGRLSDAMKSAPDTDRSRTVIRFEPAAGRMIEPPAPIVAAHQAPPQQMASDPNHAGNHMVPEDPALRALENAPPVRREMPSFFDTRLNRIGEMTRQANAPRQVEPPAQVPAVPQPPPLRHPMQAAQHEVSAQPGAGLEDAAAQLLRPILKQWLTDNMPKIVEKALRSEAGEDFPPQGGGTNGHKFGPLR